MKFFVSFLVFFSSIFCHEKDFILVTGGAGYIGSHTCKALSEAGYTPIVFDSLALGDKNAVKWGPLFVGDLLDIHSLRKAFETYKPIAVLHFAALREVGASVSDPANYYMNNLVGSLNLLNVMNEFGVKKIIFSSSASVYGDLAKSPITEDTPKFPINPYSKSKYFVEQIIQDYGLAYQINYVHLRYFNASGIEKEAGLKRPAHSYNFLIPRALLGVVSKKDPLYVFGNDYQTEDGTCIRDYIHVKDLAKAHVLALSYLLNGGESEAFNLGTGKGCSVMEMIQMIESITGKKLPYVIAPKRLGDVAEAVADVEKAYRVLQFKAEYSDLQNIIESEWVDLNQRFRN